MDNLRSVIEVLFLKQDPGELLRNHSVWHDLVRNVDKGFFIEAYQSTHKQYSEDQTKILYSLLSSEWMRREENNDSVFNILLHFGEQVLRIKNGSPLCRYEHYLRWHEMTSVVGEDIFTCSFLAHDDILTRTVRHRFAWSAVLESDNTHLEALFRRGLSELHCHLDGSSLNFDLSWLAIMNEPEYQKPEWYVKALGCKTKLYEYAILAAFIRMYLFLQVNNRGEDNDYVLWFKEEWHKKNVLDFLPLYISRLQSEITCQQALYSVRLTGAYVDYAIISDLNVACQRSAAEDLLVGERYLMYKCFQRIFDCDERVPGLDILFYVYLLIKQRIKDLIIQHNGIKGFANFKRFDSNKDRFVEYSRNKKYAEFLYRLAIESYRQNGHVDYFEFRVAPKTSVTKMKAKLRRLYSCVETTDNANVIFHFIKTPDREQRFEDTIENGYYCRNHEGRKRYLQESRTIESLLRCGDNRLVGIDAANSEFGCRPEVFAEVYRRLQHLPRETSMDSLHAISWHDLGLTYHVGEDYYDVVDGLRAIEEAIIFLNLVDGARLGHAIALGINAKEYYCSHKNTIIIPKQDLLDNCVWVLAKMDEYSIPGQLGVKNSLQFDYQRLVGELYPLYSREDYRVYYQSWLLRGDDPSMYRKVEETSAALKDSLVDPYLLNHFDKRVDMARNQKKATLLYRDYHFNASAKYLGHKPEEWKLPMGFVEVIEEIQARMRNEVARRKIAIEVNPTSNLRICNIDTYDTHPVVKFRNYGLSVIDEYNDCPQISVSINTDDKGIFATSIEKEYTLMSLALEKQKTLDGRPKFQANNILNWLEGIRQESTIQRFRREDRRELVNGGYSANDALV